MLKKIFALLMSVLCIASVTGCSHKPANTHRIELPEDTIPLYAVPQKMQKGTTDIVFTNYDASFTWKTNDGADCTVTVTLPAINSPDEFAENYNRSIESYANDLLYYIESMAADAALSQTASVSYSTYLNEELLSILITEQFVSGNASYQTATFDLKSGKQLKTPELASRLLGLDYPSFLLAGNEFIWQEFFNRYSETEPDTTGTAEIFHGIKFSIPLDTYNLYYRQLFISETGEIMLLFQRVLLTEDWEYGLMSKTCISPFNPDDLDWTASSPEDSMKTLLTLPVSGRRYYPEFYSYLLQDTFLCTPEFFIAQLSELDENSIENVIDHLFYAAWDDISTEIAETCREYLSDESHQEAENAIVNQIYIRAAGIDGT